MGIEDVRGAESAPENFMFLPWADVDGRTSRRLPVPPTRYQTELSNTYRNTCGGNNLPANIYAAYAASFRNGPYGKGAWGRRMSYLFRAADGSGAQWAQTDFNSWLDGGRRCDEGSPGYNRFVLTQRAFAGAGSSVSRHVQERMNNVTQALLATRLFQYSRRLNRILFDDSVLNMNPEKIWWTSNRKLRNRLAARGGFEELMSREGYGFYRNAIGDDLAMGNDYVLWSTFSQSASFAAQFETGEDGRRIVSGQTFVMRNGQGIRHPIVEHADAILSYLHGLESREVPIAEKPLPLGEVLRVFGFLYSGGGRKKDAAEIFKRAAMKYESIGRTWSMSEIDVSGGIAVTNRLWYKAGEQYYLASAAYLAVGDFTSARSMLHDMTRCLIHAGIEHSYGIEEAISRLMDVDNKKRTKPPSSSGGGQAAGGKSTVKGLAETGEISSGATLVAIPHSRALRVASQVRLSARVFAGRITGTAHSLFVRRPEVVFPITLAPRFVPIR